MNPTASQESWRSLLSTALAGIVAWTVFCLVGWALLSLAGTLLEAIIEVVFFWLPPLADALQFVVRFLSGLGAGVVGVVWAIVAATIAFGTYALRYGDGMTFTYVRTGRTDWRDAPRPMKDVTPPRDEPRRDGPFLPPR